MYISINAFFDGDLTSPEIEISGENSDLKFLGMALLSISGRIEIESVDSTSNFYSFRIKKLIFECDDSSDELVGIYMGNEILNFSGSANGFLKIGQSILNFFSDSKNSDAHFHLSYTDGDPLLRETNCHLIFVEKSL